MTERARYWSDLMAAWERNGLSQAEFCRQRGINGGTFAWWKRRLQKPAGGGPKRCGRPPKTSSQFVEVRLTGGSSLPGYEVVLNRGRSIRVPSQFDPQILSSLIAAVESC